MNKIGVHFAVFNDVWADDQFSSIQKAKDWGFDLLELGADYIISFDDDEAKRVKEEAERVGITLVGSMGLPKDADIGSPDKAMREKGKKFLTDCAIGMNKANIKHCSGLVHSAWNGKISDLSEKPVYWKNSVASLKELSSVYADNDVTFNVEVVNRFENFLVNSCEEALKLLDEVGSDNLGIHLDTFHMNIEEDSFTKAIFQAGDKLNHFHIGENNRKMPGLGMLPWKEIFTALTLTGYEGPVSMEPFVKSQGDIAMDVSLYRDLMDYSLIEQNTRNSVIFVRNMLADCQN